MRPIKHLTLPGYGFALELDAERRKLLSQWGEFFAFDAGETIVAEGELHNSLFLVLEGTLAPSRVINEHSTMPLRPIKRGGVFGEVNLFDPSGARATVKSLTAGEVWRISRDQMNAWLASDHTICQVFLTWMCGKFARRVRRLDDRYANTKEELDLIADGEEGDDHIHAI